MVYEAKGCLFFISTSGVQKSCKKANVEDIKKGLIYFLFSKIEPLKLIHSSKILTEEVRIL